jgi:ABC-2 type transport system permease protein
MKVFTIAITQLRRLMRDRSNIFFIFILPMGLILILGAAFGGSYDPRVGVVQLGSGELAEDLAARIGETEGIVVNEGYDDRDTLVLAVERGQLEAGIIIPADYDSSLTAGEEVTVDFVARQDESAQALRNTVESAVTDQGALLRAAAFAEAKGAGDFDDTYATAEQVAEESERIEVATSRRGEPFPLDQLGRFQLGAYSQLLLFIFLTSMNGSATLIQSRQLGVSRRMFSTPTSAGTIVVGEATGRLAIAMFQGLLIMLGSSLAFGVEWGDTAGAVAIFVLFSLGAAGTGMLMGATFKNDQQAGAVGVGLGIGLAALGGAMVPLTIMRIFSPTLWQVAHITPHAWGIEAFEELILRDGTIADIWLPLLVLAGFAVVMFALGIWRFRVTLTRG